MRCWELLGRIFLIFLSIVKLWCCCCYGVGLSPSDIREVPFINLQGVPHAGPFLLHHLRKPWDTRRVQSWMWALWLLRELWGLEWTEYVFILSCGTMINMLQSSVSVSVCFPPSPPLSPSFHQDEDYWVRKTLSGLTEQYDFKLRTKPRIFLVSFYCRCPMYILMIVELELL